MKYSNIHQNDFWKEVSRLTERHRFAIIYTLVLVTAFIAIAKAVEPYLLR